MASVKTETRTHIVLKAENDRSGNPRRVSLMIDDGEVIGIFDHGYRGEPGPKDGWPYAALSVHCTPSDYRGWVKFKREEA